VRHKSLPFYQIEGYQVKGSADMTSKRTTLVGTQCSGTCGSRGLEGVSGLELSERNERQGERFWWGCKRCSWGWVFCGGL
jgi:hypothetical protein